MTGEELFEEYKHLSFQEKLKFDNLFYVLVNNDLNAEHNRLDLIERRLSAAVALQNLTDETGGPFFDVKWIVKQIFKFTDAEIKEANAIVRTNG